MMSALIDAINTADRLATMVRHGVVMPITLIEQLAGLGFYEIEVDSQRITARRDGVLYHLKEDVL